MNRTGRNQTGPEIRACNLSSRIVCRGAQDGAVRILLLLLMRGTTAGGLRACGVDGRAAFLDVDDFPLLIDDESGSIRNPSLWDENTVGGGYFAVEEIAEQGE